jgi:hypothetical protein
VALVFGCWYSFLSLDKIPMVQAEILKSYQHNSNQVVEMVFTEIEPRTFTFTYKSFDGSVVNSQISYPNTKSKKLSCGCRYFSNGKKLYSMVV